jgi:zinc transporter
MNVRHATTVTADVGPGIAWAYEFDDHGRGRLLPDEGPIDLRHSGRFVWVHLILANARSREWIGSQDAIVPEARELLLSQDGHPRLEWRGDALWGTLYDIPRDYQALGDDPTDLRFVLTPEFLLSARHHPLLSAISLKQQVEDGAEIDSSVALFERMLVATADSVGEAAHRIAAQLDSIEDRVLSESFSDESGSLLKLRRGVSRQHRLAQASLSVLEQVEQHRAESILQVYRDMAGRVRHRVASFHADLHLQGERARLLQEEMSAQLASATNRNLFVLTIVTTVLLPPAFVTGFFGMNTKGLPFADSENGTIYAAVLCCLAAFFVYLLIRRYRMIN